MVFSWGHCTQRRMNAQANLKTTYDSGLTAADGGWFDRAGAHKNRVRTLSTASGACVRWPAFFYFSIFSKSSM